MEIDALEKIIQRIGNRYEAIRVIARDARNINNILRMTGEEVPEKPTTMAIRRFIEGKVKYSYAKAKEEQQ